MSEYIQAVENLYKQQEDKESRIFAEIDRLLIPSEEIDRHESGTFADQVRPAKSWRDELVRMKTDPQIAKGHTLPWDNAKGLRLRPAELTVWSGYNGHGKSLVLTQVMLSVMRQSAKVCIASLELNPLETLKRMSSQHNGVDWDQITVMAIDDFFKAYDGKLNLYAEVGDIEPHRVLALCRYAHESGVEHMVIDSLMKCGTTEGEYREEKKFVNSLQNLAKNTGLHIHLVAHSKKSKDEYEMPGKFDVSGSTHITNLADNVVTVARNKKKEQEQMKPDPDEKILSKPDAYLKCDKQRHGNWEGIVGLWFHKSGQFMPREHQLIRF